MTLLPHPRKGSKIRADLDKSRPAIASLSVERRQNRGGDLHPPPRKWGRGTRPLREARRWWRGRGRRLSTHSLQRKLKRLKSDAPSTTLRVVPLSPLSRERNSWCPFPSLRGAKRRSNPAGLPATTSRAGLLRSARNDELHRYRCSGFSSSLMCSTHPSPVGAGLVPAQPSGATKARSGGPLRGAKRRSNPAASRPSQRPGLLRLRAMTNLSFSRCAFDGAPSFANDVHERPPQRARSRKVFTVFGSDHAPAKGRRSAERRGGRYRGPPTAS